MQTIDSRNPRSPFTADLPAPDHAAPRWSKYLGRMMLAGLAALWLAACGHDDGDGPHGEPVDCSTATGADTYVANLSKAGTNGFEMRLVESQPAPPAKGDNIWTVQLLDDTGAAVDGATLSAVPFMPDHGHGTPITAETTPMGADGMYEIAPINLWMPGIWDVTVDIDASGTTDQVVYTFCIDG